MSAGPDKLVNKLSSLLLRACSSPTTTRNLPLSLLPVKKVHHLLNLTATRRLAHFSFRCCSVLVTNLCTFPSVSLMSVCPINLRRGKRQSPLPSNTIGISILQMRPRMSVSYTITRSSKASGRRSIQYHTMRP